MTAEDVSTTAPRRIVHLTSVHHAFDNRVFEKECVSLAEAGFDTALVVPDDGPDRVVRGVRVLTVPKPRNRLVRMTRTTGRVVERGLAEDADLYVFHDPELIPQALRLKRRGKPVIFDVHEDYVTSIAKGHWLPKPVARAVAGAYDRFERLARQAFTTTIAERYYARRFPDAVPILNYPRLDQFQAIMDQPIQPPPDRPRLLYTGGLSIERGALVYAELARIIADAEVQLVGICPTWLAGRMREQAGEGAGRLAFEGIGTKLPFDRILAAYRQPWTCGIAVMPDSSHYREKELTKFFEYMAAGLPILASDFPVWKNLIEGQGVGLCVDPADPAAIVQKIRWLVAHPEEARAMGERGRQAVRSTFNWGREAEKLVGLAHDLTKAKA